MKRRLSIIPLLISLFALPSCEIEPNLPQSDDSNDPSIPTVIDSDISIFDSDIDIDSAPDSAIGKTYNFGSDAVSIELAEGNSRTSNPSKVSIDNDNNVIEIKSVGDYVVSGSLMDGIIWNTAPAVAGSDTVRLALNGAFLRCGGNFTKDNYALSPIFSSGTSNLLINVPENTSSVIVDGRDGRVYSRQNDAGIYAYSDLKIVGRGSLRVKGFTNNGIESRKSIEAYGLTLSVETPGSCLKAAKSIILGRGDEGGSFTMNSTGEAGHAIEVSTFDETVTIPVFGNTEENDDIAGVEIKDATYSMKAPGSAIYSAGHVYMEGGSGQIESSESHAMSAEKDLVVDGGLFYLKALKGDGIRSETSSVFISGGTYSMDVGDTTWCQGIRADSNLEIRGGYITVLSGRRGFLAQKISTSGGITYVNVSEDGWKADTIHRERTETMIYIGGGNHYINAAGDGIESEAHFEMRAGLVIVAAPNHNTYSPLECGSGSTININGGTLIAYGKDGQVASLGGSQNTVVVKLHQTAQPNSYYVIKAGNSLYAIRIAKETSAICASFGEFRDNDYRIFLASSINPEYAIWGNAGLYKIRTFDYVKLICNGVFNNTNNQHPEHVQSSWNASFRWFPYGFWM